jgi:hypothetical protein
MAVHKVDADGNAYEWVSIPNKKDAPAEQLQKLIYHLYRDAKCGQGGAEFNLAEADCIEMLYDYVPGVMRERDNWWEDMRWVITDKGMDVSVPTLTFVILRDPRGSSARGRA